ncbi:two-component system response regulator CreB [Sulfitobacter sp. SK012]|uniref:response regulator transcription factor n=1 Tax=Sulfitobacter sp. SK012 TaxID=1389005 RepID=UPI000E0A69F1|nr:response regulator transcription factor [Sulfitobacter sp. SK012]AXI48251.1 two-component system response regulator CreB [Sulfitobacter sp. SK012]
MSTHILIVDDDPQIRAVLRIALTRAGHEVSEAGDGAEGLAKARTGRFDLIVLDIGMPEIDGLEVCRSLRASDDTPVLFLTARQDEIDRVLGFELGGDDYVTKPFSPRELLARIKAILKRTKGVATTPTDTAQSKGVLRIDLARHSCTVGGAPVTLTAREMTILSQLMSRPDQVMPRPALTDAVYGAHIHVSDRTLDSHLRNLRSKLSKAGCADAIETVHGVGIRMGPCAG